MHGPQSSTGRSPIAVWGDRIHVAVFLGFVWLPLAVGLLRGRRDADLAENRALAPPPQVGVDPLASLPDKFDRYYRDHFGLRGTLIRAHDLIRVRGLGVYHRDEVAVGADDWLFFLGDRVLEDFQGLDRFNHAQLQAWQEVLEGKRAWLAQRGIAYLFVVAPNKESIYPERLPDRLRRPAAQTRLDQLMAHLGRHSAVEILDLRAPLRAARQSGEVYYPLDTHWNDRGALAAYQHICAWLKRRFPAVEPLQADDFRCLPGTGLHDLCPMVGWHGTTRECEQLLPRRALRARPAALALDPVYPWPRWSRSTQPVATECPDASGRLLVFHDSFLAHRVRDYLCEHFGRSVCLSMKADFEVLQRMVEQERPQVVIEEWVERALFVVPTAHPQWTAARRETGRRWR